MRMASATIVVYIKGPHTREYANRSAQTWSSVVSQSAVATYDSPGLRKIVCLPHISGIYQHTWHSFVAEGVVDVLGNSDITQLEESDERGAMSTYVSMTNQSPLVNCAYSRKIVHFSRCEIGATQKKWFLLIFPLSSRILSSSQREISTLLLLPDWGNIGINKYSGNAGKLSSII